MKTVIISGNKSEEGNLDKYFKNDLKRWDLSNLIMVNAKDLEDLGTVKSIQDLVTNKDNIIILFGACSQEVLAAGNYHVAGLLSYGNVGYVSSLKFQEIPKVYNRLKSKGKKNDKFGLSLYKYKEHERVISGLKNTVDFVRNDPSKLNQWLQTARRAGISGSEKEIFAYIREVDKNTNRVLEGIFVEARETLFDYGWNLRPSVYDSIDIMSRKEKKNVALIYDASNDELRRIKSYNFKWPCVSGDAIHGIKVEKVICNRTKFDLEYLYGISAERILTIEELAALN